jgi:hypothetical protein
LCRAVGGRRVEASGSIGRPCWWATTTPERETVAGWRWRRRGKFEQDGPPPQFRRG